MKRFILGSLSFLLMTSATTNAVNAQTTPENPQLPNVATVPNIPLEPFRLVDLAYRGYFRSENIPSSERLVWAYRMGAISAADLVQAAITTNRLASDVSSNMLYQMMVESYLNDLQTN